MSDKKIKKYDITEVEARSFLNDNYSMAMLGRNPLDLKDLFKIIQYQNASLFTQYLIDKGISTDEVREQKLMAQVYADIVLRGLFDFIEVNV